MNTMKPLTMQEIEHQLRNMRVGKNDVRAYETFSFWVKGLESGEPVYLKSVFSANAVTQYVNGVCSRHYHDDWVVRRIQSLMDTYGEVYEMDVNTKYDYE